MTSDDGVSSHRGSAILLAGRMLSKVINFFIQVAIVRLLTKDDFGAFAYGLAIVGAGEVAVKMGIGLAANRYIPHFYENKQNAHLLGTLAAVALTIIVLSVLGYGALWTLTTLQLAAIPAGAGGLVVLTLALLAPINAVDQVCVQTLACFSRAKQIFVRKHVVAPLLRLTAVIVAFIADGRVEVLAGAYLAAGLVGVILCIHLVLKELFRQNILPLSWKEVVVPWRQLTSYGFPLISADLVPIVLTGVTTVVLMNAGGELEVASMRSVAPAAALNFLVAQSFAIMFLPTAARFFAREDQERFGQHHWQTTAIVSVISFPIFALTFGVAPDLVVLLFGYEYASAANVLAVLSIGTYISVAFSFAGQSLRVSNRTGSIFVSNVVLMAVAIGLGVILSGPLGALGAAVAVTIARVAGASIMQGFLVFTACVGPTPRYVVLLWIYLVGGAAIVGLIGWAWRPHFVVQLISLAFVSLIVVRIGSHFVDFEATYPELRKLPLSSWLLAKRA